MGSSSSWVEQVLVHGAHKDANDHPITKVASCAIATEDVEVNIVSKEFLENHLGFSESSFLELKGTEKRGAVGIATYSRVGHNATVHCKPADLSSDSRGRHKLDMVS
jgi:hypothetical protein